MTYLTACIIYFYLPLIPDVAKLAERPEFPRWRRRLYRALALGWTDTPAQHALLERAITIMAIAVIPLAISVHTVVSWIFAMTLRPGWNSSIYGPYFVVGAIYSGTGAVILSMWVLRRTMRLEQYVQPMHFRKLGLDLLVSTLLYLYFNINEYLTVGYKLESFERELLESLFVGPVRTNVLGRSDSRHLVANCAAVCRAQLPSPVASLVVPVVAISAPARGARRMGEAVLDRRAHAPEPISAGPACSGRMDALPTDVGRVGNRRRGVRGVSCSHTVCSSSCFRSSRSGRPVRVQSHRRKLLHGQ